MSANKSAAALSKYWKWRGTDVYWFEQSCAPGLTYFCICTIIFIFALFLPWICSHQVPPRCRYV